MSPTSDDFIMDFRKEEKPEGKIHFKAGVKKVRIGKPKVIRSSQKGTIGLSVPMAVKINGKTKKITETLWLSPKAFHRFRELLEACGKRVPKGEIDIRKIGRAVEGEEIYVNFVDDEQEGYDTKTSVSFQGGFISPDDYEDDDSDEDDEDDLDGDDLDDEEDDEDEDDDLDDDDEEDEEEEEDEPPAKRRKKTSSKTTKKKATTKRRKKSSDENLDDLELDDF